MRPAGELSTVELLREMAAEDEARAHHAPTDVGPCFALRAAALRARADRLEAAVANESESRWTRSTIASLLNAPDTPPTPAPGGTTR